MKRKIGRGITPGSVMIVVGFFLALMLTNTLVFGDTYTPNESDQVGTKRSMNERDCQHTAQGRLYVTDDHGRVCKWKDVDTTTNCCRDSSTPKFESFSCENCNTTTECCYVYEFCVSCCMDPFKDDDREVFLRQRGSSEMIALARKGPFDYCRAMCRTSSRSIHSVNKYRNDEKYCYGGEAPVIMAEKALLDYNVGVLSKRSDETKQVPMTDVPDVPSTQIDLERPNPEAEVLEKIIDPSVILDGGSKEALEISHSSSPSSPPASTSSPSASAPASSPTLAAASSTLAAASSTLAASTSTRRQKIKPVAPSMPKMPDPEKDAVFIHEELNDWGHNGAASPILSSSSIPFSINWQLIGIAMILSAILSLI